MRDPTREATITFSCVEKQAADFKIRIKYDGLTQSSFFQEVLSLYLESDSDFLEILYKIKTKRARMGKAKITRALKETRKGKKTMENLSLTDSEKSSLFDIIEKELQE